MNIQTQTKQILKHLIIVLSAIFVCMLLAACSSNQQNLDTGQNQSTQQTKPKSNAEDSNGYNWSQDTNEEKRTLGQTTQAKITKIVDGDTVYVDVYNKRIRVIGVDCPEIDTNEGKKAKDFTENLLPVGTTVWLEKDISETDKYDRPLRYVWLEKPDSKVTEFDVKNKTLEGCLLYQKQATAKTYKPDTKYADWFNNIK